MNKSNSTLVYSTDNGGRICPSCNHPMPSCTCKQAKLPPTDGVIRVSRETKGRKGKGVTLVKGAPLDLPGLTALGKTLKAACGSGGTLKDGVIEVQGDHIEQVLTLLKKLHPTWVIKRAGG
ncbi:MAG: translation initiation factor Sui1 [Pseudomonadota bacterium]|jgi:translation initiation factor 1